MSEPLESELVGVTLESDALPQEDFPPGDVRRRPEVPGYLGQAAAVPTYGLLQVDSENPSINSEFETSGGETLQTPAPSGPQTAPTATAVGVVGIPFKQVMTPNSDPPLSDEIQDAAEDYEEPRPQDVGPSHSATSSSSSSFPKIFVKHSALEDLIWLVDHSLPFTTDSAGVSHDDIRLLDPTKQPGYRLRGDQIISQASSSWEMRD
jgi:hypothetical protein